MIRTEQQLIVFAKSPQPGQCKTRLIPMLGEHGACELYRALLNHGLSQAAALNDTRLKLYVTPSTQDPPLIHLSQHYHAELELQQGGDLGQRMYQAIASGLNCAQRVVLIGTDCPGLDTHYLRSAFAQLQHNELVFAPVEDGGYALIGATRIGADLFRGIAWSTSRVLQQTLEKAHQSGYKTHLLDTLWDLDTPQDLLMHQQEIESLTQQPLKVLKSWTSNKPTKSETR